MGPVSCARARARARYMCHCRLTDVPRSRFIPNRNIIYIYMCVERDVRLLCRAPPCTDYRSGRFALDSPPHSSPLPVFRTISHFYTLLLLRVCVCVHIRIVVGVFCSARSYHTHTHTVGRVWNGSKGVQIITRAQIHAYVNKPVWGGMRLSTI